MYEITPMTESHHSLLKDIKTVNKDHLVVNPAFRFTRIPNLKEFSRSKAQGIDPNVVTSCAMDRSPIFYSLNIDLISLLGELQLSFLLLTFAQNFEGFEQWLDIVGLLCQSGELIEKNIKEYNKLLLIVKGHLEMCPDDFFGGLMNENRLFDLFRVLFLNVNHNQITEEFKIFCEKKFGWILNGADDIELDEDDLPTIVEL